MLLHGPNSNEPNLFYHGEITYRVDECLKMLLSCFRRRMSAISGMDVLGGRDWVSRGKEKRSDDDGGSSGDVEN